MADITIRVKNASGTPLSSVVYRLMCCMDLTSIVLNDDSACFFFFDMDLDESGDMLIRCDHEKA